MRRRAMWYHRNMQTVVPQSALLGLSAGPVISVLTLMALAVILSIYSTVDAFIYP